MSNNTSFILAMSCSVPAIIGAIKFKKASNRYKPFLLLMMVSVVVELISDLPIIIAKDYTALYIAYPVYYLIEIFLLLLFFRMNNVIKHNETLWIILSAGLLVYLINFLINRNIYNTVTNYCSICFTTIIVIFSVKMISNEVFEIKTKAWLNPNMIIAFGCVFFYSFSLLESVFVNLNSRRDMYMQIFIIHQTANIISYINFNWAAICIPSKTKY